MNSKIVGFIIARHKIDFKPDLNTELKVEYIAFDTGFLAIYYFGELQNCIVKDNQFSMGVPVCDNLLDYNLIISYTDNEITIENDWLGGIPVFYNSKSKVVSSFPKVCLSKDDHWDGEGLQLYLKYGFDILGQTPFQNIKFLRFYSQLKYSSKGINILEKDDPVKRIDDFNSATEDKIWSTLKSQTQYKESKVSGNIVVPTSGGLDSRMVNCFIEDKSRIRAYSYGISSKQNRSFEVKLAKIIADKLGICWKQVPLKNAYKHYGNWHDLYAYSLHLHGMIHMEMYEHILKDNHGNDLTIASGICGDTITGNVNYKPYQSVDDIYSLGYTHGIHYNFGKNLPITSIEKAFSEQYAYLLNDIRLYPIITLRFKMMLLSFLMTVPAVMGIAPWTPFFNFEAIMMMLNLPPERRFDRRWVKEYLASYDLLPQRKMLIHDTKNRLNYHMHMNSSFDPIDINIEIPFVDKNKMKEINHVLGDVSFSAKLNYTATTTRVLKEVLKKIGITNKFNQSLTDYQLIKALEMCKK